MIGELLGYDKSGKNAHLSGTIEILFKLDLFLLRPVSFFIFTITIKSRYNLPSHQACFWPKM